MSDGAVVIVGGTSGLGLDLARHYVEAGRSVVVTGRHPERAEAAASELGVTGLTFDLAEPHEIAGCIEGIDGQVDYLVLAAIERDVNNVRDYDIAKAVRLATLKLVGYTEVIHCLAPKFTDDSSVLMFGGLAKEKPYPGSTTVTSVNGAVETMVRTLALELKPVRVNALHPGIVGDSPAWEGKQAVLDATLEKTPTGRLVTMADITHAATFLLENRSVNGVNLFVDGGWVMM